MSEIIFTNKRFGIDIAARVPKQLFGAVFFLFTIWHVDTSKEKVMGFHETDQSGEKFMTHNEG